MRKLSLLLISSFVIRHSSFAAQPNILVILVDDMGFSDLGCYGSEFKGHRILPAEGLSLLPAIKGGLLHRVKPVFWMHLIRQWEDWAATTFVDEWIGEVRNDWGEEPQREGALKKQAKAGKRG